MPRRKDLKKVMVIGSGPIIIGQAAEFDYSGSQACRALKEEDLTVVLVNSNPATIMTDPQLADRVYFEPLTPEFVAAIIKKEKPDGLLPTLGGQVGLNLAFELAEAGVLAEASVELLGTPLETIKQAEDRELFRSLMQRIGEPVPESTIATDLEEALAFASKVGYPVVVRPAYTLGGTGGGVAFFPTELKEITLRGLKLSLINQVLVEKAVLGWKEIEYEVMRDSGNNCITVCNMENIDPMGIHTGDSIVVAPSQTLSDKEYQMLRRASLKIIRALGIEGGCNIQFALDPRSFRYYVIEVNPRVSRSSALASKATGYPIAKVAAKIAVGLRLDEIRNAVTGKTYACFEPALDYVVVKIPRFPFDKFNIPCRQLGTQMQATGEVMAIDRSFEGALLKAVRSLELSTAGLWLPELEILGNEELLQKIKLADDQRLFAVAEVFRRGFSVAEIADLTKIDPFFLEKIKGIVDGEKELAAFSKKELPLALVAKAKKLGFADAEIARLCGTSSEKIRAYRQEKGLTPVYKIVDTCAAEFEAETPYYYASFDQENESNGSPQKKAVVLGAGPIRIGQGIEFDYCSVHAVWALREMGLDAVIINNNPETVSTDFDTADRLYFEPLTAEDVLNVLEKEKPEGVLVQFGGQTALNLAEYVARAGYLLWGTKQEDIDCAEDRDRFDRLLSELELLRPPGRAATSLEEAREIAAQIGFPVLVRPSYVLGGRAMEIVADPEELDAYMSSAVLVSPRHPVLVDKYFRGIEVEVDAVTDGFEVLIPGIMQHIERAGVHSGDSIAVYPAHSLAEKIKQKIVAVTVRLARALRVKGLLNIQFVVRNGEVYVLEVNPRASRTVPFISKVTGIPLVKIAVRVMQGESLRSQGLTPGLFPSPPYVAIKVPVFSFSKLKNVDTSLGPEMKSTGEVLGVDFTLEKALYKGLVAAGYVVPEKGVLLATIGDKDKKEAVGVCKGFAALGFEILATMGTANTLRKAGLEVKTVRKIEEGSPHLVDLIQNGEVNLVINTFTKGRQPERDGFQIRRAAAELGVPCLTSLDTARALSTALYSVRENKDFALLSLQEMQAILRKEPGLAFPC